MHLLSGRRQRVGRVKADSWNDVFRGLRGAGAGASVVAGVLTGIGAAAEVGAKHPDALWIALPAASLAVSIVCAVVGAIGTHLTRPVTEAHAKTLRDTACLLIESLGLGNPCNYAAGGHSPKEAFQSHYPKLAVALDKWDNLREAQTGAEQALRSKIQDLAAAHGLTSRPYEVGVITAYVQALVDRDLRDGKTPQWEPLSWIGFRSHGDTPGAATGSVTPVYNQTWISIPPGPDEDDAAWNARAEAAHQPVDAFYAEVQTIPEFGTAADAIARVRAFRENQIPELVDDLKRIQEMDPPARKRKCPTC